MTTIVGIQADEGIVLFADTQALHFIDCTKKLPEPHHKIKVLGEYCAIAIAGVYEKYDRLRKFFGSGSLASARRLQELLESRFVEEYTESMKGISTLVALRLDKPALYYIHNSGEAIKLRRRSVALGSGARYAEQFLGKNLHGTPSLEHAIPVGYRATRHAFHDLNTGGFVDFAIITQKEIYREGVSAHRRVLGLERAIVTAAQEKYRKA